MLKLDGAAEVEEPLPELAAAAPVLLAADPEFETVTPKPVDEPTADPEAPDLVVADTVRVVDALEEALAEVESADDWLEDVGGPWMVKPGVSS